MILPVVFFFANSDAFFLLLLIKSFPICRTIEITVQRAKTALFAWSIRQNTSKPRFYSLILLALATFSACKLCKIGS